MKRILFVDDMPSRLQDLRRIVARAGVEAEIVHRPHVSAVRLPDDVEAADVLFLDHDLCESGDTDICSDGDEPAKAGCRHPCPDGRDLVDRIIALGIRRPIVIQSANRLHGPEMLRRFMVADGWKVTYSPASTWFGVTPFALVRRWGLVPGAVVGGDGR